METAINIGNLKESFRDPMEETPAPHVTDYSQNIIIRKFPLLGRLHFVNDRQGIMMLSFTTFYWVYGTFVALFIILLPRYEDGRVSLSLIILEIVIAAGCIISLFRAATTNPGRVPLLEDLSGYDTSGWVHCQKCQRMRPKRAHHCRRCQQCVLKMDHHCPWINNCVGESNHWLFILLCIYAFLLSAYAFILCMLHFWYWPPCESCDKDVFYIKHSIWFTYLLTIMGVGMTLFMTANMMGQHFNLLMDRTTLENLIKPLTVEDALSGVTAKTEYQAYRDICGPGPCPFWMLPFRRKPKLDTRYYNL